MLRQSAYFSGVGDVGGLYVCNFSPLKVDLLLKNTSETSAKIRMVCGFQNGIVFTDLGAREVKFFIL